MKKKKVLLCLGLSVLMGLSCALCACGPKQTEEPTKPPVVSGGENNNNNNNNNNENKPQYVPLTSIKYRDDFSPTKFDGDTVTYEITELGKGAWLVANTVTLSGDRKAIVYAIEVDLNFANIVAGTKNNATTTFYTQAEGNSRKAAPYAMAQAWEQANQGGHVYSSLNADFFGDYSRGGVTPINAFVKDGVIITDCHVDNGNYDYKQGASDVPASAPMLFGVKGNKAQIAPIIQYEGDPMDAAVKETLIKAKLSYETVVSVNGNELTDVILNELPGDDGVSFINASGSYEYERNTLVIKLDELPNASGVNERSVISKDLKEAKGTLEVAEGETYILVRKLNFTSYSVLNKLEAGDKLNCGASVVSPDGTWDGYTTILGTRQSLVIDGEVPDTVAKENTNGAQTKDIPRSGVGIKENGHVVIFTVEAMRYNPWDGKVKPEDTHGMNLPEFAEFMKFYGVEMGTNFDGGGSTQLVCRGENEETGKVYVRSSDTANTGLTSTRSVINAILVTNKLDD